MKTIKTQIILILLSFVGIAGIAQQNDADAVLPDSLKPLYNKVMIIPFEENMYLCGIQSYLAQESGKTHDEIVSFFREGVALELQNQFLYKYNTVSLMHMNDSSQDLFKAYDAIGYKFELAPLEEESTDQGDNNALQKAKNLFAKKKKATQPIKRGTVQNGQIVSEKTTGQKFANVIVTKKENLTYLHDKYQTDLFVYITEMDIENDITNQTAFINNEYKRFLKLHYSMVDKDGKIVEKGIVYTKFPNSDNDIKSIRVNYLPLVAKKLSDKLPMVPNEDFVSPVKQKGKAVKATDKIKK